MQWKWHLSLTVFVVATLWSSLPGNAMEKRLKYPEIVSQFERGAFDRATILYVPISVATIVRITPDQLLELACRFDVVKNSPEWRSLGNALKKEEPTAASVEREVRVGILLQDPEYGTQKIFMISFEGPTLPDEKYFGYVNGEPVFFGMDLLAQLRQLIAQSKCANAG
jgi:hypothetical protein